MLPGIVLDYVSRYGARVRVPWSEVAKLDSAVCLKHEATELGLGRGDDRLRPYVDRIPGAGR